MNGKDTEPQGKIIALFSDGTGNSAAKLFKTNVWRMYQALDLEDPPPSGRRRQIAFYDDGVGTSSFKALAILGGIFGFGLKRNVLELYQFACRNYRPGDEILAFGFSRGAFTIRILVALIAIQGLRRYEGEQLLEVDAKDAYRKYRRRYERRWTLVPVVRAVRDFVLRRVNRGERSSEAGDARRIEVPSIAFVGVWDTVAAYGLPFAELTRGFDRWVWPLSMPNYELSPKVRAARHALALDDERDTFHPLLWDEVAEARMIDEGQIAAGRLLQVWFAGMHSDVGGGYPHDGLAHVPLQWMMQEAEAHGLRFRDDRKAEIRAAADAFGPMHQSRSGFAAYYRYQPRRIDARTDPPAPGTELMRNPQPRHGLLLPPVEVHASVRQRIERGVDAYAPIVLPSRFVWLSSPATEGGVTLPETLWNEVWRRRVNYFAAVALTLMLAAFPWLWPAADAGACRGPQCLLAPVIRFVGGFVPAFAGRWLDAYAASPGWFLVWLVPLLCLPIHAGSVARRIQDRTRRLWCLAGATASPASALPERRSDRWIFRLRMSRPYRRFFYTLKWRLVPTFFGWLVLAGGAFAAFWLAKEIGARSGFW